MARPEGEPAQSENRPSRLKQARHMFVHALQFAAIGIPVYLGVNYVLYKTGVFENEEETQSSTASATPDVNIGVDPLTNCPAEATLTEPEPGDEVWPDLLLVSFPGKTVPAELQAIVDRRNLCFFTYVPVNDEDPFHLLWLEDPSKLHEVKAQLDPLVESGVITSVDFSGVSRAQESAQPTE